MRPALDLLTMSHAAPHPGLIPLLAKLASIRLHSVALQCGDYQQLHIAHQLFAFARKSADDLVVVVVNASAHPAALQLTLPTANATQVQDLLNPEDTFPVGHGVVQLNAIWPHWARILAVK